MFGVPLHDAKGGKFQRYLDVIHPDDRTRVRSTVSNALNSKSGQYEIDYRLCPPGKEERWVVARGKVERDEEGRALNLPGVVIDITDRKKIEEALRTSEERFRLLADNMSQFAWIADETGAIFWYNQRWYDFTGTNLEAMKGWGWEKVHHPEHVERITKKWKIYLEHGWDWEETFPLRGKDGEYRWFLTRAFPIRDNLGKVIRWFGTNTDITDVRLTQEALRTAQEALAKQNQHLDQTVQERTARLQETIMELEAFSYSISHDMRSPLRAMQGYAEALLHDYKDKLDAEGERYLQRILRGATRLDLLIRDVLAYSKVARGQIELRNVNLNALLQDILQNYPNLHSSKIDVRISDLPNVWGHEGLLTQVISNLLANAAKFVKPGAMPQVDVSSENLDGETKIWFSDHGLGIAPEHQKQIFEIFGRVYPEKQFEGTGIGLAIVKKALDKMGGSVGVISELGKGSRFWINLKKNK
jgi:PAS domain S-box-containing protein